MRAQTNNAFDRRQTSQQDRFANAGGSFPIMGEVDDCPTKDRFDRHAAKAKFRDRDRRRSGRRDD